MTDLFWADGRMTPQERRAAHREWVRMRERVHDAFGIKRGRTPTGQSELFDIPPTQPAPEHVAAMYDILLDRQRGNSCSDCGGRFGFHVDGCGR